MPLDAQQRQAESAGNAGEIQLIQAVEQEHLLDSSWQAFEAMQQGISSSVLGSR
ncbi:hypothetical protein D3C75_1313060 [compost metagenome]